MTRWLLTLLVGIALVVFIAKPVTATTVDRNGTEVAGTCGALWSLLAGDEPTYDDAAATDGTDIGVREDPQTVHGACRANADRRLGLGGGVLAFGVLFARFRLRRGAPTDDR